MRSVREYTGMHQRAVHHDVALPISAVFRMRYPRNLVRLVGRIATHCRYCPDVGSQSAEW
jgi:hypothetical protein